MEVLEVELMIFEGARVFTPACSTQEELLTATSDPMIRDSIFVKRREVKREERKRKRS